MTMDMNHETILGLGFGEEKTVGRWGNDQLEEYYLVYSLSSENLADCRIVVYERMHAKSAGATAEHW